MYKLKKIFKNEKGQGMVEYGLILALVSIVAILGLSTLGGNIKGQFEGIADSMGGSGGSQQVETLIKEGYIPVATADELNNVRSATVETYGKGTKWEGNYTGGLDKQYIQVANIDLSKFTNFEPIGKRNSEFTGTFDGGDYVISNLKIDRRTEECVGLFGWATGATFKNVGLEDVNVTGRNYVGGLVGRQNGSSVTNSYATGSVNGTGNWTGGLVGFQNDSSAVTNSYATGSVTGKNYTGGLVGTQDGSSTVSNSYATGSVTGTNNNVGGLVGEQYASSTVSNSYATGNVTGMYMGAGGLVGYQRDSSSVTNSYATGSVTGRHYTGGLVGQQSGSSVSNSYATGSVTGTGDNTGGLVGSQDRSSVSNSYATGSVTGVDYTGGLVGFQYNSSTVTNSYYDTETTGQSDTGTRGTGKTTTEMKNKGTYTDWDFDTIWEIEDGQYPTLR